VRQAASARFGCPAAQIGVESLGNHNYLVRACGHVEPYRCADGTCDTELPTCGCWRDFGSCDKRPWPPRQTTGCGIERAALDLERANKELGQAAYRAQLSLADCDASEGRLLLAWREALDAFKGLRGASDAERDPDTIAQARSLVKEVLQLLPHVTFAVPEGGGSSVWDVTFDGHPVTDLTRRYAVDPGLHVVRFSTRAVDGSVTRICHAHGFLPGKETPVNWSTWSNLGSSDADACRAQADPGSTPAPPIEKR
jgi:hypothetical protein